MNCSEAYLHRRPRFQKKRPAGAGPLPQHLCKVSFASSLLAWPRTTQSETSAVPRSRERCRNTSARPPSEPPRYACEVCGIEKADGVPLWALSERGRHSLLCTDHIPEEWRPTPEEIDEARRRAQRNSPPERACPSRPKRDALNRAGLLRCEKGHMFY